MCVCAMPWSGGWRIRQRRLAALSSASPTANAATDPAENARGNEQEGEGEARARSRSPPERRPVAVKRLQTATSVPAEQPSSSSFRQTVGSLFLSNKISAKDASEVAAAARDAGATGSNDIASIGTAGRYPGNYCRDLMRALLKGCTWPSPYWFELPVLSKDTGERVLTSFPVLLPHEGLQALAVKSPDGLPRANAVSADDIR